MARRLPLLLTLATVLAVPGTALGGVIARTGIQGSPQIAARPDAPDVLVLAATSHEPASAAPSTRVWRSSNAGATWSSAATPTLTAPIYAVDPVAVRGAPAVALAPTGGFVAFEASEVQGGVDQRCAAGSGVYVASTSSTGVLSGFPAALVAGPGDGRQRRRPTLAVDPLPPPGGGQRPLLAVEATSCPSGSPSVEVWSWSEPDDDYASLPLSFTNAEGPALASNGGETYLAYVQVLGGGQGRIDVRRCIRAAGVVTCGPRGSTAAFALASALSGTGAPAVDSAPDLAVDEAGHLHLAWTAAAGATTDVLYSRSTDGGATWTPATAVAGPVAGADEFLPAVAVAPNADAAGRLRADVSFLVRRSGETNALAHQASTNGTSWGQTVLLPGAASIAPRTVTGVTNPTFGERVDALSAAPTVPANGVLGGQGAAVLPHPPGTGSDTDISFLQQPHGSIAPVLSGVGGALLVGKNGAVALAPPTATDADGDPVTRSSSAVSGDTTGDVYRPAAQFAGSDAVRFSATDGYTGAATVEQPVTVTNATPVVLIDAHARAIAQGSVTRLQLSATDADAGDALTWSLSSVPAILAGRVTLTAGGELTVDLPPAVRSVTPLPIGVQVSDTTPQIGGTALGTSFVKVAPTYAPVTVTVSSRSTGNTVQFGSVLEDGDVEAVALAVRPAPVYLWTFGDGATPRTSSLPNPRVRFTPGSGSARWTLTVTVPRAEGVSVTPTASGLVTLRPEGRSLLALDQRIDRRRARLTVALRTRASGTVEVALRVRGRRTVTRRVRLTAGSAGTLGRTGSVAFDLRGVHARTADLVVSYASGLAGQRPTAVRRKIRLR